MMERPEAANNDQRQPQQPILKLTAALKKKSNRSSISWSNGTAGGGGSGGAEEAMSTSTSSSSSSTPTDTTPRSVRRPTGAPSPVNIRAPSPLGNEASSSTSSSTKGSSQGGSSSSGAGGSLRGVPPTKAKNRRSLQLSLSAGTPPPYRVESLPRWAWMTLSHLLLRVTAIAGSSPSALISVLSVQI